MLLFSHDLLGARLVFTDDNSESLKLNMGKFFVVRGVAPDQNGRLWFTAQREDDGELCYLDSICFRVAKENE